MEDETESVEIRKVMMDSVRKIVREHPAVYDNEREFVEAGVRNELIQAKRMKR